MKLCICVHVRQLYAVLKFEASPTSRSQDITCQSCVAQSGFAKLAIFANVSFPRFAKHTEYILWICRYILIACTVFFLASVSFSHRNEVPLKLANDSTYSLISNFSVIFCWTGSVLLATGSHVSYCQKGQLSSPYPQPVFLFNIFISHSHFYLGMFYVSCTCEWYLTAAGWRHISLPPLHLY